MFKLFLNLSILIIYCLFFIAGSCDNSDLKNSDNSIEIKIENKDTEITNTELLNTNSALINEINSKKINNIKNDTFNNQINLLNDYFFIYDKIDAEGGLVKLPPIKKNLVIGDSSFTIQLIKQYLLKIGDIPVNDNTGIFDSLLLKGIKSIQFRLGMETTGIISKSLVSEMNIPVKSRVKQISINIERFRKFNQHNISNYLLVNIPEFKLHLFKKNQLQWSMDIIVGKVKNPTAVFENTIQYVVFSPYWNVPNSILNNELMPLIRRNRNYISSHNMEWTAGKLRQRPGADNPLGLIKFLFPNKYNIYLHDTPMKSLFKSEKRAFSHGCIRIADAPKLAEYLLKNDTSWNIEKIRIAMNANIEHYVKLKYPLPILINYFTSWVDEKGLLHFTKDIYKKDIQTK